VTSFQRNTSPEALSVAAAAGDGLRSRFTLSLNTRQAQAAELRSLSQPSLAGDVKRLTEGARRRLPHFSPLCFSLGIFRCDSLG
jgi:hypothetical protein